MNRLSYLFFCKSIVSLNKTKATNTSHNSKRKSSSLLIQGLDRWVHPSLFHRNVSLLFTPRVLFFRARFVFPLPLGQ